MKRRKLSNKTKGKILIGIPTLIIVGVLSVVLFSRFDFDYFWNEFLKKTVDNAIGKGSHIVILSLIACPVIFLSMTYLVYLRQMQRNSVLLGVLILWSGM